MAYRCTVCSRDPREILAGITQEQVGNPTRPKGEETMTSKKPRVKVVDTTIQSEKPVAVIISGDGPAPATTEAKPAEKTPQAPKKAKSPTPDVGPQQPNDSQDQVVFAFRLTRAERDELHAAVGSGKASRFVKAITLAAARGDMKAVQELIDEVNASRQ
jgi:hypothetical protein